MRARAAVAAAWSLAPAASAQIHALVGPFVPGTGRWSTWPNGGFETGTMNQWFDIDPGRVGVFRARDDHAAVGTWSARAEPSRAFTGPGFAAGQRNAVVPGRRYVVSVFLRKPNTNTLYIDQNDAPGEVQLVACYESPEWQFYWAEWTPTGASVTFRLCCDGMVLLSDHGWIDELALTPAEEFVAPVPQTPCMPNCDTAGCPNTLDIFDFLCFQNRFDAGDPYACDCDTGGGPGVCDIFDFLCFQNAFAAGCP